MRQPIFGFEYEGEAGKAYNRNFYVRRKLSSSRWVGKISNSLAPKGVNFQDLDDRARLAHRLARLVRIPVTAHRLVSAHRVAGLDLKVSPDRIGDMVWLSKYWGETLPQYLQHGAIEELENKADLWRSVVFNLWIGNYDRKDEDYLVDADKRVMLIDYHLWGPGFKADQNLALGAYAEAYSLDDPPDTGWCVGLPNVLSWIKEKQGKYEEFEPMIAQIERLPSWCINLTLAGLSFSDEGGEAMDRAIVRDYLLSRRSRLRGAIREWIKAGYPKSNRPKVTAHADDLYPKA